MDQKILGKRAAKAKRRSSSRTAALISIEQEGKPKFMHPSASKQIGVPLTREVLQGMGVKELRRLATARQIKGRSKLNKTGLVDALAPEAIAS